MGRIDHPCRFEAWTLEARTQPDVPERTVETKGTAGAWIPLAIRFAAGLGIDRGFGGVGDDVRDGVENIASPDGRGQVLEHLVGQIEIRGPFGGEQLAWIVVLIPPRTVVVLVHGGPK